jgi:hypothetical protein
MTKEISTQEKGDVTSKNIRTFGSTNFGVVFNFEVRIMSFMDRNKGGELDVFF